MKRVLFITFMLSYCTCDAQQARSFKALAALTGGAWQMPTNNGFTCERWKKTGVNQLFGIGFRVVGKDTVVEEKVRLVNSKDGVYYIPTVTDQNNGKEVSFKLISDSNGQFVFANPAHDFPQRVVYQLVTRDSLHAWIDGTYKDKFVKKDFYYKRIHSIAD